MGTGGNQVKVLFSDGFAWPSGNAARGANLPQLGHTVSAGVAERLAAGDSIERPHCGQVTGICSSERESASGRAKCTRCESLKPWPQMLRPNRSEM